MSDNNNPELWVALRLPWPDGSGDPLVLGVHDGLEGAALLCWRDQKRTGDQPTEIVLMLLNDPELPVVPDEQ